MFTNSTPIIASKKRKRSGFALIATLMLMVLLMLLVLGMLSLSAVTMRYSSRSDAMSEARSNARMALMIAIGELQKEMGPDQRISVTANQRMAPGGDGEESSAAAGNMHWTGVYDSWLETSEDRPTPAFRSWLVSGNANEIIIPEFPETALSGGDVIELVGVGTAGPDVKKHVKVRAVEITDAAGMKGRIAWWIGDQGVKAAIATPPSSTDTSLGAIRNNLMSAPRNAVELVETGNVQPFALLGADDPRIPLVTSWQQSGFLASDPTAPRPLFHDLAAFSTGLLTDVRSGGFRKDLSMKFETYTSAPDLSEPKNVLYTARSDMTGNDEVGINFMELWGYYHLYKELKYGGSLGYTTGGSMPSNAPYLQTKTSPAAIAADLWDRFKHPITINYQAIFSFEVAPYTQTITNADGSTSQETSDVLWLNFDPVVTLWNPLDVAVDIPKHATWNYLYEFWVIPYDINIKINGGAEIVCSLIKTSNDKNDANFLRFNAGVAEMLTLKPGEVVKISQEGNTSSAANRGSGVGGFQGMNGKKGFNYGGGTRQPLLDQSEKPIEVEPNDSITYSATPNGQGAGGSGNSQRFSLTHNNLALGGRGGLAHSFMSVDSRSGYSRVQVGETRTMSDQGSIPNPFDIRANDGDNYIEVLKWSRKTEPESY